MDDTPGEQPIDELGPVAGSLHFSVVGIGASAGGLEAFTQLLRALPVDTGMAFVLVQHLAPHHASTLAGILSRETSMPVTEVTDEPQVEPNRVYVIPPDRDLLIARGHLQLSQRKARGAHHPIDSFFRSLAEAQRGRAIGVVLSGAATDGTLGLEQIKAEGGITFAQDGTAQYSGMPQSAVASGCVDFVLSPERIAGEIARIATHPYVTGAAAARTTGSARPEVAPDKAALAPILRLLHDATGVDFALYKANTLSRRIARRMVLLKLEGIEEYARLLEVSPDELHALHRDILINVTSFFRDPEVFEAIRAKVIPALVGGRSRHDPLRIWVCGCSTGEEAYSLAMTLAEASDGPSSDAVALAQVFATDLSAPCIEHARAGVYPKERLEDVSPERLRRFFVEAEGGWRVTKQIRDMCVFATHNVFADPPFSRLDLISCRNLLIYLERPLQERMIPLFHYALKPRGLLVLGTSETVGAMRDLFHVEDAEHKIFAKKPGPSRFPRGLPFPHARAGGGGTGRGRSAGPPQSSEEAARLKPTFGGTDLLKEADRLLAASFAPPGVLVDANFEILQFRGNIEPYLTPAEGKASLSLLKMARDGLLIPLRALLHRAKKELASVRDRGVRIRWNGGHRDLDLQVVPVKHATGSVEGFLVLFEEVASERPAGDEAQEQAHASSAAPGPEKEALAEATIARLEHELASTREYLQSLVEQHDAATEELQAAVEEGQSANEELQSINEELETSREEIQSSNEELTTLNDELQNRSLETVQLNDDLTNLISSVQTAIVMVGRDLRIRRFSPMATKLLNILPADVGRPIQRITPSIELPDLGSLLVEAIDTMRSSERQVRDELGRTYSLRIAPFKTLDNKIDGAVLMLVDVDLLQRARQYAENIVGTLREPLLILDADLRVRNANRSFFAAFGGSPDETQGRSFYELSNSAWDVPALRRLLQGVVREDQSFEDYEVEQQLEHGKKTLLLNARRLLAPAEDGASVLLAIEDITERKRADEARWQASEQFRFMAEAMPQKVFTADPSGEVAYVNPQWMQFTGLAFDDIKAWGWTQLIHPDDVEENVHVWRRSIETGEPFEFQHRIRGADGAFRWHVSRALAMRDVEGNITGWIGSNTDIDDVKRTEAELHSSAERFRVLFDLGPVAVFSCNGEGVLENYNRRATELWGREPKRGDDSERFCGSLRMWHPDGRPLLPAESPIVEVLRTGTSARDVEVLIEGPDGSRIPVVMTLAALKDEHGGVTGAIIAFYDVSERRRLEEELRRRLEELASADSDKVEFLAALSHELRNPLNAIRGWLQILQRPGAGAGELRKGLAVIDRNSKMQSDLIEDLLEVHRIASGKVRLAIAEIDVRSVLAAAVDAVSPAAAEKAIRIDRDIELTPVPVSGDPNRLQQVFGNLLVNAIKFTPREGEVRIALKRSGSHAEVSVSDSGEGIDPESLPHIFQRFRQGERRPERGPAGLGLGLAIAKQLVELHHGDIGASSPGKGQGSTFTVTLPISERRSRRRAISSPGQATGDGEASLRGMMVLIVDDEVDAREPLRRALEEAGAEVVAVTSADEATAVIRQQRVDVLVSDIGMPQRDGYDLIRAIRALPPERGGQTPAIALTAYGTPEDRSRALRAGFQVHLVKPADAAALLAALGALRSGMSHRPPKT